MDCTKLKILVAILAATNVFGKEKKEKETHVKNEIKSFATSENLDSKKGATDILRQFLQRSHMEPCGIPNPKCTTECFAHGLTGCYCLRAKPEPSTSYYIYHCRDNSTICQIGEHELFNYTKINQLHSASQPAKPSDNIIRQGVTEEEKQEILDIHNTYRAKVARGEEYRSPQQNVSQPSGTNMKEIIWNYELAFIAQKWADQCNFTHEMEYSMRSPCSRPYERTGQNLYSSDRSWEDSENQWHDAITAWYDEVADSPVSIVAEYAWGPEVTTEIIGHYTQLVWAETYDIGCGAVYYTGGHYENGSSTLYVCNYGPAGNVIGDEIYKIGTPASGCGESCSSTKYSGLCATEIFRTV